MKWFFRAVLLVLLMLHISGDYETVFYLTDITAANGNTISLKYDSQGNLLSTPELPNFFISWNEQILYDRDYSNYVCTYDSRNLLLSATSPEGTHSYRWHYDPWGQKQTEYYEHAGVCQRTVWSYDWAGRVVQRSIDYMGQYPKLTSHCRWRYDLMGNILAFHYDSGLGTQFAIRYFYQAMTLPREQAEKVRSEQEMLWQSLHDPFTTPS